MMNKEYALYNLKEANEAIEKIIQNLEKESEYDKEEYYVDMQHLYNHINSAWNSRFSTKEQSMECSEKDFNNWRQFPNDINMDAS